MIKVSVTVPVYNAEKYLKQCLDSIQKQTLKDIEVIMIDDGSTDGSAEICKQYLTDSRFSYYHKENEGRCINQVRITQDKIASKPKNDNDDDGP